MQAGQTKKSTALEQLLTSKTVVAMLYIVAWISCREFARLFSLPEGRMALERLKNGMRPKSFIVPGTRGMYQLQHKPNFIHLFAVKLRFKVSPIF